MLTRGSCRRVLENIWISRLSRKLVLRMSSLRLKLLSYLFNPISLSLGIRLLAISLKSLQIIVLVRIYGVEIYGSYAVAMGLFTLSAVIGRFGLDHFSLREANQRNDQAYGTVIFLSFCVAFPTLASTAAVYFFVKMFYVPETSHVFGIFVVVSPIFAIMWNQLFILRGAGWVNTSLIFYEIINPILLLIIAYLLRGNDLGLAYSFLAATTATAIITYFIGVSKLKSKTLRLFDNYSILKTSLNSSKSFYSLSILEAVRSLADSLAVGFFLQTADAAYYAIATRMAGVIQLPISITTIYMNNLVARSRFDSITSILETIRKYILVNILASGLLSIAALVAIPFVEMLFKVDFSTDAKIAYVALILSQFLVGCTAYIRSTLVMSGREQTVSRTLLILSIPYILSLMLLTKYFGLIFVGIAFLAFTIFNQALLSFFLYFEKSKKLPPE